MEHITTNDQYAAAAKLVEEIENGLALARSMMDMVVSCDSYADSMLDRGMIDRGIYTGILKANSMHREYADMIIKTAPGVLHQLRRELCYFNFGFLGQNVPDVYLDNDLERDTSDIHGCVFEMPKLKLTDETIDTLMEWIHFANDWSDSYDQKYYENRALMSMVVGT